MVSKVVLGLKSEINQVPTIGPSTNKKLSNLGIRTVSDLLRHFPTRYLDLTQITPLFKLKPKIHSLFSGTVISKTRFTSRTGKLIDQVTIGGDNTKIKLTWFNSHFASLKLKEGNQYLFSGKPSFWGDKLTVVSPNIESNNPQGTPKHLTPIYPLTKGLSSKVLSKIIATTLSVTKISDPLPANHLPDNLPSLSKSFQNIHFPPNLHHQGLADLRLSFNYHLHLAIQNRVLAIKLPPSPSIKIDQTYLKTIIDSLPYTLHREQQKALSDCLSDLQSFNYTNRLIHGETGSGKTVISYIVAKMVLSNKYSFALLAPTQILTNQHANTFSNLDPNLRIQLLTSKTSYQKEVSPTIYIGTHSLLTKLPVNLTYPIAAVFVDEQHRFGVDQRESFLSRNPLPHMFNLSATPIPRTIALGLYGEVKISKIRAKAIKNKKIKTYVLDNTRFEKSTDWIVQRLKNNEKIFVVCPLIHPNSSRPNASVLEIAQIYHQKFSSFTKILILHGQMPPQVIQHTLDQFRSSHSAILISTSLIEVGIDIPQAQVMIIHQADTFGLAQLHQLRGRVGRSGKQAYCFLLSSTGGEEIQRLMLLTKYQSGLTLARHDLALRGAGELGGLKQHGFLPVRLKNFWSLKSYLKAKTVALSLAENPKTALMIAQELIT